MIAGVLVSMKGVRVLAAAEVLCGKVVWREMGEMGGSDEGGVEVVMVVYSTVCCRVAW